MHSGMFKFTHHFISILKNLPNLESLRYEHSYLTKHRPFNDLASNIQPVPMKHLKCITADHSCHNLLLYFIEAPLTTFKVLRPTGYSQPGSVFPALNSWNNLQSFEINHAAFLQFFESDLSWKMPFKLKHFSFLIENGFFSKDDRITINLGEFFKLHRETLVELRMEIKIWRFLDILMNSIFTELKVLRKFSVNYDIFTLFDCKFKKYEELPLMPSVKKVVVYNTPIENNHKDQEASSITCRYNKTLLKNFPELEIIRSDNYLVPSHWLVEMSLNNPKVKEFRLRSIDDVADTVTVLTLLKTLRVGPSINVDFLINFVSRNPSIEILSLHLGQKVHSKQLKVLLNLSRLRKLTFVGDIETMRAFHDIFQFYNNELVRDPEDKSIGVLFWF